MLSMLVLLSTCRKSDKHDTAKHAWIQDFFSRGSPRDIYVCGGGVGCVCMGGGGPRHISAILFCKKFEFMGGGVGSAPSPYFHRDM